MVERQACEDNQGGHRGFETSLRSKAGLQTDRPRQWCNQFCLARRVESRGAVPAQESRQGGDKEEDLHRSVLVEKPRTAGETSSSARTVGATSRLPELCTYVTEAQDVQVAW